jgi:hypothetical protein
MFWKVGSIVYPAQQVRKVSSSLLIVYSLVGRVTVCTISCPQVTQSLISIRFAICNHARCESRARQGYYVLVWRGGFVTNRFVLICGVHWDMHLQYVVCSLRGGQHTCMLLTMYIDSKTWMAYARVGRKWNISGY